MAGFFSGLTVCHTAALVAEKHRSSSSQPTVYVCTGGHPSSEELEQAIAAVGCKSRNSTNHNEFRKGARQRDKTVCLLYFSICRPLLLCVVCLTEREKGKLNVSCGLSHWSIMSQRHCFGCFFSFFRFENSHFRK